MPLGFPTAGCCGSCDASGAPNAVVVTLLGYTGSYSSINGSWKLYAAAWDTGECTYFLNVGPARPDPNNLVNTDCATVLTDFRATILCQIRGSLITVEVIDGAPGGEPGGSGTISSFSGSIGAIPTNCLNIDVGLTLGSTVGGSGTPTCSVEAAGPGRHCIYFNGCPGDTGSGAVNTGSAGGAGGSSSPLPKLRQPGRTTNCRQACLCGCVCNSRGRPNSVTVQFENFSGGCPNPNPCTPYFSGAKFVLDFTGLDKDTGNCLYGAITNDLNYYLLAILGFDGEPSEKGVFARVEMHRDRSPDGTLEFAFEIDHLEWQTTGYTWGGPGTFPCAGGGWSLSCVVDNGNLTDNSLDGGPCITTDLATTKCLLTTSADYSGLASVSCCCGGATDGGRYKDLYVCIQSEDPLCQALNGVLVQLELQANSGQLSVATWTGTATLDNGSTVTITLTFSNGQWHGSFSCNGGAGVPFSVPSLNSSTTLSTNGCCTGSLTLTLTDHPVACGGNVTSGAAGCCGCAGGVSPPNNLLLTVNGVGNASGPCAATLECADLQTACVGTTCERFNGVWVLDYVGLDPLPGCEGGCNPCSRCHYQLVLPIEICANCGAHPFNMSNGFDAWIDWQGNVEVRLGAGLGNAGCWLIATTADGTAAGGCPTFDVDIPVTWGGNCAGQPTLNLKTL